eukprot:TRINITY_DN40993_c0_g1_i1.p1 TRINITY_DN40993_c0_g1~~TRINITY_DN40993_c0_g1_i1.p1  ORF type:complete len:105 (-),score=28.90 TRINITY_DN40993_c0_g1_i1:120-434(-)
MELDDLVVLKQRVLLQGMALDEVCALCNSIPDLAPARAVWAEELAMDQFRKVAVEALCDPRQRVLINYHMTTLGQWPYSGHVSPLVAYHPVSYTHLTLPTKRIV